MKSHKLDAIPGAPPNLKKKLTGCRFFDRCKYCSDACKNGVEDGKIPICELPDGRYYRCILSETQLRELHEKDVMAFV